MSGVFDFHVRLTTRPGAAQRLLETLRGCGIDRAVVSAGGVIGLDELSRQLVDGGFVTTDPDNDAVLRACTESDGTLIPYFFANPHRDPEHYRSRAQKFRGVEISPAVHGVPLTDQRTATLVAIAAAACHSVYVVCITRPGCEVADLVALAQRFPEVRFVLGHSGIGNIDFHGVNLVAPQDNILLETSGGYTTVLRAALDRLGAHRVLFGSEHPLQHPQVELAKFACLGLPEQQWRQVSWDNAARTIAEESR